MLQIRRFTQLILLLSLILAPVTAEELELFPSRFIIPGVAWRGQTWNNCGPANLALVMNYWGWKGNQFDIEKTVRPNPNDPHVSIEELAEFARSAGFGVHSLDDAKMIDLKSAMTLGTPVIVPTWHVDSKEEQMGHYRILYGYDDETELIFIRDTLEGPYTHLTYEDFQCLWAVLGSQLLIITSETDPVMDQEWINAPINPSFAPLGSNQPNIEQLEALMHFSNGMRALTSEDFKKAVTLFNLSRTQHLPWRIWWYRPEALEAYIKLDLFDSVLDIANYALRPYPYSEELFYWKALALDRMGKKDLALENLQTSNGLKNGWIDDHHLEPFSPEVQKGFPGRRLSMD